MDEVILRVLAALAPRAGLHCMAVADPTVADQPPTRLAVGSAAPGRLAPPTHSRCSTRSHHRMHPAAVRRAMHFGARARAGVCMRDGGSSFAIGVAGHFVWCLVAALHAQPHAYGLTPTAAAGLLGCSESSSRYHWPASACA